MWQRVIRVIREFKGTEPDIVNGSILQLNCAYLAFVCWRYFNLLHRADEPQKGRNSCPRLQPYFIGFCRVGVSQSQFFYVVSALQFLYIDYSHFSAIVVINRVPIFAF